MFRSVSTALPLVCLVFILAGPVQAQINPCSLITQAEAEAILGEKAKPPRSRALKGLAAGLSCTYFTAAPLHKRGATGQVSLLVHEASVMKKQNSMYSSPAEYFKRTLQATRRSKHAKATDIKGLGDAAWWQPGSDRLHVLNKGVYLILKVHDIVKFASNKGSKDLAAKVSAHRLKKSLAAARKYLLPKL